MRRLLAILLLTLVGCASITPQTPAQAVFSASGAYAAALTVAVQYINLPPCIDGEEVKNHICSNPQVVEEIRFQEKKAWEQLQNATNLVRLSNASDEEKHLAASAARASVASFTSLTSTLKVK